MGKLESIIGVLASLSDAELDALGQRIKALRSLGSAPGKSTTITANGSTFTDIVFAAVADVLKSVGAYEVPYPLLQRAATKAFHEKMPYLEKFITATIPDRRNQRALLGIALNLMHKDLAQRGMVISARTLMAHIHLIPATLDRHFPGYAAGGALGWIVGETDANV